MREQLGIELVGESRDIAEQAFSSDSQFDSKSSSIVRIWRSADSAQSFEIIEYPDYGARNNPEREPQRLLRRLLKRFHQG